MDIHIRSQELHLKILHIQTGFATISDLNLCKDGVTMSLSKTGNSWRLQSSVHLSSSNSEAMLT